MVDPLPDSFGSNPGLNGASSDDLVVGLVDDDPAVLQSLAALLEAKGYKVRTYTRAANLLMQFDPADFACVVSDFRMPDINGLQLLEQLRARGYETPVIILTAYADVPMAVGAIRGGALTVLEKPSRDEELFAAIDQAFAAERTRRQQARAKDQIRERYDRLSSGERDVIRLALAGKMNREIADELGIGLRTVEKRRHNAMKKMQADSLAELMRLMLVIDQTPPKG